jgi:carboxypeptidase Taq
VAPSPYDDLVERVRRATLVGDAGGLLRWDQEVMMPDGGTPARSAQLSALSSVKHEIWAADATGDLVDELEDADLDPDEAALVREARRHHRRAARVPRDLVEEISRVTSEALPRWREARDEDDWSVFAPHLEQLVDLRRDYADHIGPDRPRYEVLFADYEPYLPLETVDDVLGTLRDAIVPLLDEIRAAEPDLPPDPFEGTYPEAEQRDLAEDVLDLLGYDRERGRLDVSAHPFTSGTAYDTRITTRFDTGNPLSSLLSTVHEFGHAHYNLGLPRDDYGTPLGEDRDLTVHESQSRLWENHVGRSRGFLSHLVPRLRKRFPQLEDLTLDAAYAAANRVREDNLIRVEADELTYHLHIVLRYEIERDLVAGDLEVEEVPQVWRDLSEAYLGLRPETDAEGALQDIHWSHGSFGYFPTYSLGSVLAAQVFEAVDEDVPGLDDRIHDADLEPLSEWLRENVHRHGQRLTTPDLVKEATGQPLSADAFLDHVGSKFGDLYGL